LFFLLLAFGGANVATAQGLIGAKHISSALAHEAVGAAVAACAKNGYAVTAIIVSSDGVRQAMLRGDGAAVHTLDSAYAKAYTAASLAPVRKEDSTKAISERIAKTPGVSTAGLASLPNINFTPGGVTIIAGGEAIGGIGVGGAPGGNFDDDCARAALAQIRDRMK
jgi:uncharacterized protein GlcG (DUF336 family)